MVACQAVTQTRAPRRRPEVVALDCQIPAVRISPRWARNGRSLRGFFEDARLILEYVARGGLAAVTSSSLVASAADRGPVAPAAGLRFSP